MLRSYKSPCYTVTHEVCIVCILQVFASFSSDCCLSRVKSNSSFFTSKIKKKNFGKFGKFEHSGKNIETS